MDSLRRTFDQYAALFKAMTPSQRGTLVAVPLMLAVAFGVLMFRDGSATYVALSYGKSFSTEEIINAEQTLKEKGLSDFRREGRQILAPAGEAEKYNAALLEAGSLPENWAEELEKQIENKSIFASRDELVAMKEIALAKQLHRVLRAVPDIEDASVMWDRPKSRRFGGESPKVTALVSVRPRPGREISSQLVGSLRAAVANMVPDLTAGNVTVFDESTGIAHTPDQAGDPFDSRLMQRVREFTKNYERQISRALDYIPNVVVTVNVDLENIKSSTERATKVNPKETVALHSNEFTRSETSRDQPSRAEPGNVSNRPRELQSAAGQDRSRNLTESNTQAVSATSFIVTDRELIAAMPRAVQVSVAIPEDYYRGVALKRGLSEGDTDQSKQDFQKAVDALKTEEEQKVKAMVVTQIPAGSPDSAIQVSSIVRLDPEPRITAPSWTEIGREIVSEWGSAAALSLMALGALWMLSRNMQKLPDAPALPPPALDLLTEDEPPPDRPKQPVEVTARDELQNVVRDNPEMTASVLMKWLQAAK